MIREIDAFYLSKKEPVQSCLLAMRNIILEQEPEIAETQKYGMPCFTYLKKPFCYLWTDKKSGEPYILMVKGSHLQHPELEQGNRSRMKILRIPPDRDLPISTILEILNEALNLHRDLFAKR
jgi:hypothetical protein